MTSINFNAAANSALRTLQSSNAQLDATQNRISTGLKIADAKDNAAYWSISTTLKSDNKALGTVKDALNLGAASVDTAYQGLNETISILDEIKSKLTAASGGSVDKLKVNAEIQELKKRLEAIAGASTFSGENWLKTDASVSANLSKNIVSGFTRAANGAFSLDEIVVDTTNVVLVDTQSGTKTGILQVGGFGDASSAVEAMETAIKAAVSTDNASGGATAAFSFTAAAWGAKDVLSFDVTLNNGTTKNVRIDQDLVKSIGDLDTTIDSGEEATLFIEALKKAGVPAAGTAAAGTLGVAGTTTITITGSAAAGSEVKNIRITNVQAYGTGSGTGVLSMSLTGSTTATQIEDMVATVNYAIDRVTTAAASLGAVAARVTGQKSFVEGLMATIDKGVSGLVDADMNEESTKLQALQVKQQLGVQALSIANQSAQNVLSLFRS